MSKIQVIAAKDFFDRGNMIQRKKGDQFTLKAGYAGTLERVGYIKLDAEGKKAVKDAGDEVHAATAPELKTTEGKDMSVAKNVTSAGSKTVATKTATKTAAKKTATKAPAKKTGKK